jgi:hypothetical protein
LVPRWQLHTSARAALRTGRWHVGDANPPSPPPSLPHRQIVTYINNHHASLAAWKATEGAKALLKPGETRFATCYILIERLVEVWPKLDQLVASDEWVEMVRHLDANGRSKADKVKALVRSDELHARLTQV